jgi:hypothetical protein
MAPALWQGRAASNQYHAWPSSGTIRSWRMRVLHESSLESRGR